MRWTILPGDKSNQNANSDRDRESEKRTLSGLAGNALKGIVANFGAELDGLIAEIGRLVDRHALAAAETIDNVAKDRPEHVGNLVACRGSFYSRTAPGFASQDAEVFFDGAEMTDDVREPWIEFRRAAVKHHFSPRVGCCRSGAFLSGGISGVSRCGSVLGTGGMISGFGCVGSLSTSVNPA
jgi:hypothetical protein